VMTGFLWSKITATIRDIFQHAGFGMFCVLFSFQYLVGVIVMTEVTMMLFEKGPENNIRCRAINGWFKRDSYVSSKDKLFVKIEKIKPNVVVMDLGLYEKIDGIETSRVIRSRFNIPVMYV
jgi:CheY-like chemotaxis protein